MEQRLLTTRTAIIATAFALKYKGRPAAMPHLSPTRTVERRPWSEPRLRFAGLYRETELLRAALRVYTKPLFQWRKALVESTDGRTLYDFAGGSRARLERIHRDLMRGRFRFRPARAAHFRFNGRPRTLYISPWEERIVDLALYRMLNRRLHGWFSPNSYAYRDRRYSLDACQHRVAAVLRDSSGPVFAVKRDIRDYFASVDHGILLEKLKVVVEEDDVLFHLLEQRIRFRYREGEEERVAERGIPFGAATACLFANLYLNALDAAVESVPGIRYFRYADDLLILTESRDAASEAVARLERGLEELRLSAKDSHTADMVLRGGSEPVRGFTAARSFRHLGLEFRDNGSVGLSRDKARKICNLFRYAFRRDRKRLQRITDPQARVERLVAKAREAVEASVRNVAIVDYYLKHVDDEAQLQRLDRWLAEEVLSLALGGGHRKGHFRRFSFQRLREMGLPSLLHRRRLILHGHIASPFFVWKERMSARAGRRTVARSTTASCADAGTFSPVPEAAARKSP